MANNTQAQKLDQPEYKITLINTEPEMPKYNAGIHITMDDLYKAKIKIAQNNMIFDYKDIFFDEKVHPQRWPDDPEENILDEEDMETKNFITIRDARSKHYEIFKGTEVMRGKKEATLKYIESLGTSTQTDISEWKLKNFMEDKHIILDRNKINKIFFKLQKSVQDKYKSKNKIPGSKELKELSDKVGHLDATEKLKTHNKEIADAIKTIENYKRDQLAWERELEARKLNKQKTEDLLKNQADADYSTQIKELLKTGKFFLAENQPKSGIAFLTAPINKSFFCKEQATNLIVPLGQYRIEFRNEIDNGWKLKVMPGKDNVSVGNYIHPHVLTNYADRADGICWGAMIEDLNRARKAGNFFDYMMVCWDTLANFQEAGGAYTPLYKFENAYKNKIGVK